MSSPGEPKVLTFYQAVETASINNEQTDVRHLWQLNRAAQIENTTTNDPYGTNSSNSDSQPIIPVTLTNTINDISTSSIDKVTTLTPDTLKTTEITINFETTQQPKQTSDDKEPQQISTDSTVTDSPTVNDSSASDEITTNTPMSTSTEMITEVSVSIRDNLNNNNVLSTTSPSMTTFTAPTNSKTFETSSSSHSTAQTSTEMPLVPSTILDVIETTTSSTTNPEVNVITEVANSRSPKRLDDLNSEQPEVSNSLLDITLSASNNETTKPTFLEFQVGQELKKTKKLQILSQVKANTASDMKDELNSTAENITEKLKVLAMFDIIASAQPTTQAVNKITVLSKSSQTSNLLLNTSITTETVPEINIDSSSESVNLTVTEPSTDSTPITTTLLGEENQKVTTTQLPEFIESITDKNVIDTNNTSNTLDIAIQFYNVTNATVPAGTENFPMKNFLSNKDMQSAIEKFLYSVINSTENTTSNNFSDNILMSELMKIVDRFSVNSTNLTQSAFNFDENNVDSSPDGLPQLLGGFLDHTNKTQSVTNSTVETNNETSIVAQTTITPSSTLPSEQVTNSINTGTTTEIITTTTFITHSNSETSETFPPVTTVLPLDIPNNNSTNITDVYAPYITRMLQIFAKLIDPKILSQVPADLQPQELDSLTPNSTETLPDVESLTKIALIDESTNIVPTTVSIDIQTAYDLKNIAPTVLTRFQESTPATAQRTAGANIQSHQTFTTLNPAINRQSSSAFSSTIPHTNDLSNINPQSTVAAKTTTIPKNNLAYITSSTFTPSTTAFPAIFSTNIPATIQQPTTTASFAGRFGTSRLTPSPKFSSSSSTTAPLRDYLIYGILPNKTIVRKRPEDNLIDARNVDSPYVIFGLYPDGKLVRKFPNGTVIPDPPSNPVEVVFSLSTTTTTNRPRLPDNQANTQGMRNQKVDFTNNRNPVADVNTQNAFYAPNEVDNALGFSGPIGFDLPIGSVGSDTKEMVYHVHLHLTLQRTKYDILEILGKSK